MLSTGVARTTDALRQYTSSVPEGVRELKATGALQNFAVRREDRTSEAETSQSWLTLTKQKQRPAPGSLREQIQREARLRSLGARNGKLLDNAQLEQIWYILRQYIGLSNEAAASDHLNYDEFCQAGSACQEVLGSHVEQYFTARVFLRLERDSNGAISLLSLFNYIMRRNAMLQTRVHLSCFDEDGCGALTEEQFQEYVAQLVPELPGLAGLQEIMPLRQYCQLATRRFWLFNARHGRMGIRDLLPSAALAELLELRLPVEDGEDGLANNFSIAAMARLVSQFQDLDKDGNGHLSRQEFTGFSSGTMSALFVDRVYEEHVGKGEGPHPTPGEMDLYTFAEFVLAWDSRDTAAGVRYFFPVLDFHSRGYVTQVELYAFLKEVYAMWVACGQYPELSIEDVKDEIFDIVQPVDELHITAGDLMESGMAGTVIGMLSDVNLFWEYDNRESLLQTEEAAAAAAAELP